MDGSPSELGNLLSKSLGAHLFPISREFNTWRIVPRAEAADPENNFTIDITALRGGSIEADLLGRDFTINSIAIDLSSLGGGEHITILDPHNGLNDISDRKIRCERAGLFTEDPLRLIRALRFENVLGFKIDEGTEDFIKERSALIGGVSGERIREEILHVFHEGRGSDFFERLNAFGLLKGLIPELYKDEMGGKELSILRKAEFLLSNIPEFLSDYRDEIRLYFLTSQTNGVLNADILKLSSLIYDLTGADKPIPLPLAGRLRLGSKGERLLEQSLSTPVMITEGETLTKREVYRLVMRGGEATVIKTFLSLAVRGEIGVESDSLKNQYRSIFDFYFIEYPRRGKPLLNGTEIMEHLNIPPGPVIGKLFDMVEEEHIVGNLSGREDALRYIEGIEW